MIFVLSRMMLSLAEMKMIEKKWREKASEFTLYDL